jgi:para-nitrobenzyl esterase
MPQPVGPWQGVLSADKFGPACMQIDDVPKSEDCLTINVWRPAAAPRPLLVMVWIHGGAMVYGGTPVYPLAAKAPSEVRGNYGFMDQLAALWKNAIYESPIPWKV